jgi:hypothetical protein
MNASEINKLQETKQEIIRFNQKLEQRLQNKEITEIEKNLIIHEKFGNKTPKELINYIDNKIQQTKEKIQRKEINRKQRVKISIAAILLLVASMIGVMLTNESGITGFSVLEITTNHEKEYSANETFNLNETNITSIKATGILRGEYAKIVLQTKDQEHLIAELKASPQIITNKEEYSVGEEIIIITVPNTNNTLYYNFENQTKVIENVFTPQQTGEYNIFSIIEDNRVEKTVLVVNQSNATEKEIILEQTFTNVCKETCSLNNISNASIRIILGEDSSLYLEDLIITVFQKEEEIENQTQNNTKEIVIENKSPLQIENIEDITLTIEEETTINLSNYFEDPEQEELLYESNEINIAEVEIVKEILTIKATQKGTQIAYLYVTDGEDLLVSDTFKIIIEEETTKENRTEINSTNSTSEIIVQDTVTNQTQNITTNTTTNMTDCNDPDINKRPPTCFLGIENQAFHDLTANIENPSGKTVARFTRFGNLIIEGILTEQSATEPNQEDFSIGYTVTENFVERKISTAWIDTNNGNLHLKGQLYQEQVNLQPPQYNSYIVKNKFGIILGYFNEVTGDLYLKGNIVQLGDIK